jgi:lauroyl/myristoyl acyltransferase
MAKWARTLRRARRRALFITARQLVRASGFRRLRPLGRFIGDLQYLFGGRTRRRCLADMAQLLQRSVDDPLVANHLRASYRTYAMAVLQVMAMCDRKLPLDLLSAECRTDGLEHLQAALARGKGAILLAKHAGNSLLLPAQLASAGLPMTVVYRQALMMSNEFFAEGLPRYGIEGIAANDGAKAYVRMRRAIKNNRVVFVMIDQGVKAAKDGVPMRFLGKDMPMPAGPAQLARHTGAPVFPLDTLETEPVWHFLVEPAVQFKPGSTLEEDLEQLVRLTERQLVTS